MNPNPFAQIDDLIKANKIYRFEAELECTTKERAHIIKRILDKIRSVKNPETVKTESVNNYMKILKESQYKKKWHTLNMLQKTDRLNLYTSELGITDAKLKTKLISYVDNGDIKTKDIKYDTSSGKITEITLLKKDKDDVYVLDVKTKPKEAVKPKEVIKPKK